MSAADQSRSLPAVFDRIVVILTGQAHLFALFLIVSSLPVYRSVAGELLLWLFSMSVPLAFLVAAQRSGGRLSTRVLLVTAVSLLIVDLGGAMLLDPAELGGPAMWTWGVVGVTVLTLAPFRPIRDILLLGVGHGVVISCVIGWVMITRGPAAADGFRLLADLNAGLLPALAAAQFVGLYVGAVRAREVAARQLSTARAATLAAEAVGTDTARRLAWLRAATVPLLRGVAEGTTSAADPTTVSAAQRLSRELRRELLDGRTGAWLLDRDAARPTDVLDPQGLLPRLQEADRVALAVFIECLRKEHVWERLSVALVPSSYQPSATSEAVTAVLVAAGPGAARSVGDLVTIAAAKRLGATVSLEEQELLVAEVTMPLRQEEMST